MRYLHAASPLIVASVVTLVFCSGVQGANVTVHITKDQVFVPETVDIQVGDSVTWLNDDSDEHTATRTDAPSFDTGLLSQGQSGTITFTSVSPSKGFEYFCVPHPFMTGHVVVRSPGIHMLHNKRAEAKELRLREATTITIHIKGHAYVPDTVEIQVGDTVAWVNDDSDPHTATRTDSPEQFDTGVLKTGKSNSHTFQIPSGGTGFEYFCVPHPFMKGRVVVKLPGSHLMTVAH
jgi:plastocyanin